MKVLQIVCVAVSVLKLLNLVYIVLQMQSPTNQDDLRREKLLADLESTAPQRKDLLRRSSHKLRYTLSFGMRNNVYSSIFIYTKCHAH